MKIVFYCQHVLGIGHFFRALEICRALSDHEVTLVTGGETVGVELPGHVRHAALPGLMMDPDFSTLFPVDDTLSLETVQTSRRERLFSLFDEIRPDLFLVELYPFGRKAFSFELEPLLSAIREKRFGPCRVLCSLRDILVEKRDTAAFEERVVATLNRWFDGVLVHGDPEVVRLEETFSRVPDIEIPLHYTGYVTRAPDDGVRLPIRNAHHIGFMDRLMVVSAGGGRVGGHLFESAVNAFSHLFQPSSRRMWVFTGPYLSKEEEDRLRVLAEPFPEIRIERFTPDFPNVLAAADLSVSMGGYNTLMNVLAAGVPALVFPFDQNREQRMRAEKLAAMGVVSVLKPEELSAHALAHRMESTTLRIRRTASVRLDGAAETARVLAQYGN